MSGKWFFSFPLLTILIILLTGCATRGAVTNVQAEDARSTIEVTLNDVIEVTLAGNITTGYTWEWDKPGSSILELQGEPEYKAESDLVGAPGAQVFKFNPISAGTEELHLIYHRTFEPDVPPLEEFMVTIEVK